MQKTWTLTVFDRWIIRVYKLTFNKLYTQRRFAWNNVKGKTWQSNELIHGVACKITGKLIKVEHTDWAITHNGDFSLFGWHFFFGKRSIHWANLNLIRVEYHVTNELSKMVLCDVTKLIQITECRLVIRI